MLTATKGLLLSLLLLTSCTGEKLSVFTEYVSIESLPSYQIKTPDLRLYNPEYGEKLHITWKEKEAYHYLALTLYLEVIYGDGTDETVSTSLYGKGGTYVFSLMNEDYFAKGGIFAYRASLYGDDKFLAEWVHPLFARKIEIGEPQESRSQKPGARS